MSHPVSRKYFPVTREITLNMQVLQEDLLISTATLSAGEGSFHMLKRIPGSMITLLMFSGRQEHAWRCVQKPGKSAEDSIPASLPTWRRLIFAGASISQDTG